MFARRAADPASIDDRADYDVAVDAFATVRAILACDLACDEDDLLTEGTRVVVAESRPGRRRFPREARVLMIATMGAGTVISCDPSRLDWARTELGHLGRDQLFAAAMAAPISAHLEHDRQFLAGPDLKFVCTEQNLHAAATPPGVQLEIVEGSKVAGLYAHRGFRNALSYATDSIRPDRVAAVARIDGTVVDVAGASEDCERMWQIGVDVVREHRRRGLGRALVSRLTREVLSRDRLPYYTTAVSNLGSSGLALGLGYRLAWVELYARRNRSAQPPGF
jgi:GNAT superfamily N-acetyltransferase